MYADCYIVYWMPFGYQINLNNCSLCTACEAFIHINVQATLVLLRIYIYMVSIRNANEIKKRENKIILHTWIVQAEQQILSEVEKKRMKLFQGWIEKWLLENNNNI